MEDKIPSRKEINQKDKWNLTKLYKNFKDWERDLDDLKIEGDKALRFKGKICENINSLKSFLEYENRINQLAEKLGTYIMLKVSEDLSNQESLKFNMKYQYILTDVSSKLSYSRSEILATNEKKLNEFIGNPILKDFEITLAKLIREKKYILTEKEENLLALSSLTSSSSNSIFSSLTDADFKFGTLKIDGKDVELTQSTLSIFLNSKNRETREKAYKLFYKVYDDHKNSLANIYSSSIQKDIFYTRARDFNSCLEKSLYPKNIDKKVYMNLISTVKKNIKSLHKYYELRKKILKVDKLKHFDISAPLVNDVKIFYEYNSAVEIIIKALKPLGEEYCSTLKNGLLNGWVDKYENRGKRSGAFSAGSYFGDPYILLNYKPSIIRDLFTLAHEGGHSMHSYYSIKNNLFQNYDYTIFEAEVASTFNEHLLANHLKDTATDKKFKTYIIGKEIDDIIATLFRQTMFAEFELICHESAEKGISLTLDFLRSEYKKLLVKYFGKTMNFEEESDLEALRIPHFYRAFYVFQYATGISAAISLGQSVLKNEKESVENYLKFLSTGGSAFPIDSLKKGGVDMTSTKPIQNAINYFKKLIKEFELLNKDL